MSTDIKLRKAHLSKMIQSGGYLGKTLGNMISKLAKEEPLDRDVHLVKGVLPILENIVISSVFDKSKRKISG